MTAVKCATGSVEATEAREYRRNHPVPRPAKRVRGKKKSGVVSPRQVSRKPLEGRRQLLVVDVPEGSACVIFAQHPDRRQELPDPHLGAEPPDFIQPMQKVV